MKRSEIRRDPDKIRAFQQRGREQSQLGRSELQRKAAAPRKAPKARPVRSSAAQVAAVAALLESTTLAPSGPDWRCAVAEAAGGVDVITGAVASSWRDQSFQGHHPLEVGHLKSRGLLAYKHDVRNGLWVQTTTHDGHNNHARTIAAEDLRPCSWQFAAEMDALGIDGDGDWWATIQMLRDHPPRDRSTFMLPLPCVIDAPDTDRHGQTLPWTPLPGARFPLMFTDWVQDADGHREPAGQYLLPMEAQMVDGIRLLQRVPQ